MVYGSTTTSDPHVSEGMVEDPLAGDGAIEDMSSTEKVVVTVMLAAMAVVGTVGNALAIYVFARLKQKVSCALSLYLGPFVQLHFVKVK